MKRNKPYVVGLTGLIGAGKSTCAEIFERNGIPVVDADKIANDLLEAGGEGLELVREAFGDEYVLPDGSYNRELMKETILADEKNREKLNRVLHPLIGEKVKEEFEKLKDYEIIVYDCPLLVEADQTKLVDEVFFITAEDQKRLERLSERDGISKERAKDLSDLQLDEEEQMDEADTILYNDSDEDDLEEAIETYIFFLKDSLQNDEDVIY